MEDRMPREGEPAPEFRLPSTEGKELGLGDFKGRYVVLYFYPRDDTPGCTKEACGFRDSIGDITAKGGVVLGVSTDDIESHEKFQQKYGLNFPLLSDAEARVARAYGVYVKKNLYGKERWGVRRSTFVIGPDGRIVQVFPKVSPEDHAAEISALLASRPRP
jgi:peroxiredoxin Q/BCP